MWVQRSLFLYQSKKFSQPIGKLVAHTSIMRRINIYLMDKYFLRSLISGIFFLLVIPFIFKEEFFSSLRFFLRTFIFEKDFFAGHNLSPEIFLELLYFEKEFLLLKKILLLNFFAGRNLCPEIYFFRTFIFEKEFLLLKKILLLNFFAGRNLSPEIFLKLLFLKKNFYSRKNPEIFS